MSWSAVGSIGVTPKDTDVLVGEFTLGEEHDTLFFRVTQTSPQQVWNYSFGLLTWRSSLGQELGTAKVYGSNLGECYRLGIGLPPVVRTGSVYFTPRAFNRRWIDIENPPIWALEIEAQSAKTAGVPVPQGIGAVVNSFVDTSNNGLSLVRVNFP